MPRHKEIAQGAETAHGRPSELKAWVGAISWIILIFVTVPVIRKVQEWIATNAGSQVFGYATVTALIGAAVLGIVLLHRRSSPLEWQRVLWLAAVTAVAIWWAGRLWSRPEEAIHLVEYGLLALLLAHALGFRIRSWVVYPAAVLFGALVGCLDEFVQWLTPGRYFDFRDIWINAGAGSLAVIALWKGLPPLAPRSSPTIHDLRLLARLAAGLVALLTLFLAATPARIGTIDSYLPWSVFDHEDVIVEYGLRHEIPDIGIFFSRFTLSELADLDREIDHEMTAALAAHRKRYGEFLRTYNPGRAPFAYEARVHFFSRLRNLALANENSDDPDLYRQHMSIAQGEDRIISSYFSNTEVLAGYELPKKRRAKMVAAALPEFEFESKAAAHLITRFGEGHLRILMVALMLVLIAADRALGRRDRRRRP
ncbi:MAG: VanZ family protein [Acidobacteriota bacterium]